MMYAHAPLRDDQSFLSNFVIEINGFLISCSFERTSSCKQLDKNEMITSNRSSMMIFKADEHKTDYTKECFNQHFIDIVDMQRILHAYTWCAEFKHK